MNDFNQLTEEQKLDCCQALTESLQMTIHVYVHSNEIENLPISAVLDSLMMLAAAGLEDIDKENKQEYISGAISLLRKVTDTELT